MEVVPKMGVPLVLMDFGLGFPLIHQPAIGYLHLSREGFSHFFRAEDIPSGRVVHLKGFANELGMYYDEAEISADATGWSSQSANRLVTYVVNIHGKCVGFRNKDVYICINVYV